ncbi:hypothetical protein [Flaviaesturariibacter amylovorans]|uniref:DUF1788 domain-containing protein n=1 Tax=Flaviaesturariibacter amylovorans TaxID=1084520 RepID=A0ABP8HUK6_9BACT
MDAHDIEFIRDVYALASNKYKPVPIRVLLLAEAPPEALDRHFYFEDVRRQDALFLEIMGVLYPRLKQKFLESKRSPLLKEELLRHFQSDGYFLTDLCEVPWSLGHQDVARYLADLVPRLDKLITRSTPILLIKASTYDLCYRPLTGAGFNVHPARLPFPGSGMQRVFRERFSAAVSDVA